jgi:hypothetical protein
MQELIKKITDTAGITEEQAAKAIDSVKEYIKEKFPMVAGAVDNLFKHSAEPETGDAEKKEEGSIIDKISDVIPGDAGQKVEDFAKNATHKAEEAFENVKDKLSGLFGGDKK